MAKSEFVMNKCLALFSKDYKISVIDSNASGELSANYPSKIPILEYSKTQGSKSPDNQEIESLYDIDQVKDLFVKARFARCRSRFAVPVILFEGKHILRSGTISGGGELYCRSGFDLFTTGGSSIPVPESTDGAAANECKDEWQLFNRVRGQDIKLLKLFSVGYIVDLMVEKKKVKFGVNVTSSEKVDKENRYSDFTILAMPYPGCEFFREWRDAEYRAEGMKFNWRQGYVDSMLDIPGRLKPPAGIDYSKYKQWDLITLTQNYLKLLLHFIKFGDSGLLIHCISGWDRTPLFVALIRLSLWADGLIHTSLSPTEIVYLVVSYDWYLFGHNFADRLDKGEDILFFCFFFLQHMTSTEFSVFRRRHISSLSATDSEGHIDGGVLLDTEQQKASYRGSSSSINSESSATSSLEHAPLQFTVGSPPEDDVSSQPSLMQPPPSASVMSSNSRQTAYHSTSPMAVPTSIHCSTQPRNANSPVLGSWQMISGSGSLRGSASTSSHDSPHVVGLDEPSSLSGARFDAAEPAEHSVRKDRLDAVRQIFLSSYGFNEDDKLSSNAGGGGLTALLGNFAEKVGFRGASRNTVV
ncbi:hypothetical protein CAPTEDRAFT_228912 [Capitella teleta]|uniref:Myotubularin phosphatase domain-containing protein n=1 Tax=Capitella teleta TaxID=283909 RepID=R7VKV8_CAPTE|nr:hypothetical protein CAPTEDRAFT_228912 [Capitella teleta]|eukprot:ELU17105.1 hypothetical protein CAPTEDRAFT_228912 [Capitella teleta]